MRLKTLIVLLGCVTIWPASSRCPADDSLPPPGTHGHYAVLTATPHQPPPFAAVDIVYGPREEIQGTPHLWWQLEVRGEDSPDAAALLRVRALTRQDPLRADSGDLQFVRYLPWWSPSAIRSRWFSTAASGVAATSSKRSPWVHGR